MIYSIRKKKILQVKIKKNIKNVIYDYEFWKKAVSDAIAKSNIPLNDIRKLAPDAGVNALLQPIDAILKRVFELLYPPE